VAGWLKGLAAGLLIGAAGALLIGQLTDGEDGVPEQLAEALGCSSDVIPSTAAAVHHAEEGPHGYSWFAATHAERILYVNGCDPVGPGTRYLEFGSGIEMGHVLATLRHYGAVCVVGQAVFDGKLLNGRAQLEELCSKVSGRIEVL
jgi:hypothetical protein